MCSSVYLRSTLFNATMAAAVKYNLAQKLEDNLTRLFNDCKMQLSNYCELSDKVRERVPEKYVKAKKALRSDKKNLCESAEWHIGDIAQVSRQLDEYKQVSGVNHSYFLQMEILCSRCHELKAKIDQFQHSLRKNFAKFIDEPDQQQEQQVEVPRKRC